MESNDSLESQIVNNTTKKILIVDDEVFNIEAIKSILESVFFMDNTHIFCESAMNGRAALEKVIANYETNGYRRSSFDLIFMDSNMPVMDGFDSTTNIRNFYKSKCLP